MPVERSAGIIFFRNTSEGRKYLVVRSSRNASVIVAKKKIKEFWDLPKGMLEKGEKGVDAAKREAEEEVGIKDFEFVEEFKETARYFTWREGRRVLKFVAMFLAEAKTERVKLSWEHDKYEWLSFDEAARRVTLNEMGKILVSAENFLQHGKF